MHEKLNLKENYLFANVSAKVNEFKAKHPNTYES